MFRSDFDHPQGDIFSFTSVTKGKIIWFVLACLYNVRSGSLFHVCVCVMDCCRPFVR